MIARSLAVLTLACALVAPLAAQTLERVRAGNVLTLGYIGQLQPFSSGPVERPVGYVIELCQRIAERIRREQALPQLRLVYLQVAREQALAALREGQVDLLCSPLVESLELRRSLSFSQPIYPAGRGVAVRPGVSPALLHALEGRVERTAPQWRATLNRGLAHGTFAVIAGSSTELWVRRQLRLVGVLSEVVTVQGFAEGLALLETGKADAFFGDRTVLQQLVASSAAERRPQVLERIFELEPAALALPRGDEDLRLLVDSELSQIYRSGEIEALYRRHFGEPGEQMLLLFRAYALP